jgi:hypothetical protein
MNALGRVRRAHHDRAAPKVVGTARKRAPLPTLQAAAISIQNGSPT